MNPDTSIDDNDKEQQVVELSDRILEAMTLTNKHIRDQVHNIITEYTNLRNKYTNIGGTHNE